MINKLNKLRFKSNSKYKEVHGKYIFIEHTEDIVSDELDFVKHYFKRYKTLYRLLKYTISPIYFDNFMRRFIKDHIDNTEGCFLNLGGGSLGIHQDVINVDIFNYEEVGIVCDIEDLPVEDNTVDVIFNLSVLEHLAYPENVIKEIFRVLRPGGLVYSDVPFVVGFHASPHDYGRWTEAGLRELYKDFEILELNIAGGPTSALLWIFQEWLAMLLSFNSKSLYKIIYIILMILTFPIKYLDIILRHHPAAKNISASFVLVGRKKDKPANTDEKQVN